MQRGRFGKDPCAGRSVDILPGDGKDGSTLEVKAEVGRDGKGWRGGGGLGCFSTEVRSGGIEAGIFFQNSKADIDCCASSQLVADWLQLRKPLRSSGNRYQQAALWQHLVGLQLDGAGRGETGWRLWLSMYGLMTHKLLAR